MFNETDNGDDDDGNGSKPPDLTKKRKRFSPEEDKLLKALVAGNRQKSWDQIAREMPGRTARQCRDRYKNYLSPTITKNPWTTQDDILLYQKFKEFGRQWAIIAKYFPGRTDIHIKNRWVTISHKLGIDPSIDPQHNQQTPGDHPIPVPTLPKQEQQQQTQQINENVKIQQIQIPAFQ